MVLEERPRDEVDDALMDSRGARPEMVLVRPRAEMVLEERFLSRGERSCLAAAADRPRLLFVNWGRGDEIGDPGKGVGRT